MDKHPLYDIRKNVLGLSQQRFAQMLGYNYVYIGEIERREKRLNEDMIARIYDVFGIEPNMLLGFAPSFTARERALVQNYRALENTQKAMVDDLVARLEQSKGSGVRRVRPHHPSAA